MRCDLGVTLRHANIAVPEHLAHRLDGDALFERDERSEGMPRRMGGERHADACAHTDGLQAVHVPVVGYGREQSFPFIAFILADDPDGLGEKFDAAQDTCLMPLEFQPGVSLVVQAQVFLGDGHQVAIGRTDVTGKQ